MQKGRVGREEGEEGQMCLRGGQEAVLTIGAARQRQQRTHAVGRVAPNQAGVTSLQRWHS
jgi:hypothetical protein